MASALSLAASDLHGYGHTLAEVIWHLLDGAGAADEPEKREAALKTIANAFMNAPLGRK